MNWKVLTVLFFSTILFVACSKDKDERKPTIIISSPVHLQEINGIDTIQVKATVNDDVNITRVTVSLRNENDIPVLPTITKTPNTKDFNLNVLYFFDDIHLPSGEYKMRVSASDGENTITEYVTISLNETPIRREGLFVISNTGSSSDIYLLDNQYNANFYQSINGNYLGAAVNSFDQQLIHASTGAVASAKVVAIDIITKSTLWNISPLSSPPIPFYTSFLYHDRNIFLGKKIGGLQGFGDNGVGNFNANAVSGLQIENTLIHDDLLIAEHLSSSGSTSQLTPYWMATGAFTTNNSTLFPNEKIVKMFTRTANEIIVITNDGTLNGNLKFYKPNTATLTSFPIGLGKIDDCLSISSGFYLVVHNGDVSIINVNVGFPFATPSTYIAGTGVDKIWYDNFTNELFVASGSTLRIYDYPSKVLKGTYIHTGNIKEVLFWYNK